MARNTCVVDGCDKSKEYCFLKGQNYCVRHINGDVSTDDYMDFFRETILHQRYNKDRKTDCKELFDGKHEMFKSCQCFEHVYLLLKQKFNGKKPLFTYDCAVQISRYYNFQITKVYLVGKGPIEAANKLKLYVSNDIVTGMKYSETSNVIDKLSSEYINNVYGELSIFIGDELETILCYYQK